MDDTQVTKRKIGRMIAKNLIVMLVAVIVALTGVLAWFSNKTSADADGISVECKAPDGIEIAIVAPGKKPNETDYITGSITLSAEKYSFMKDLVLSEVTSDGKTFYKPALIQSNGLAHVDINAKWENATANESYLSFDLYIRSKTKQDVKLTTNSKFTTASDVLLGENCGNKSTYGDFSRDCIVGASRFSIVDYSTNNNGDLILLWIPRPDIYFETSGGNSIVSLGVTKNDYEGVTYKHNYYEVTDDSKTLVTMDSDSVTVSNSTTKALPDNILLTKDLGGAIGDDLYYTKCLRCNMWIDGEDTEDRLALVKGKFKIYLDLTIK